MPRHVEWMRSVLFDNPLDLSDITLVCQIGAASSGSPPGRRAPQRFSRVCAANTGLPDGTVRLPRGVVAVPQFRPATPDLPIGMLVSGGVRVPLTEEVIAAYDAPFPDATYQGRCPRVSRPDPPEPRQPGHPATTREAWSVLETFTKPFLCAFSDKDPITRGGDRTLLERIPGTKGQPHTTIGGRWPHFLQEDTGRGSWPTW